MMAQRNHDTYEDIVTTVLWRYLDDPAAVAWCEAWVRDNCLTDQTDPRRMAPGQAARAAIGAYRKAHT